MTFYTYVILYSSKICTIWEFRGFIFYTYVILYSSKIPKILNYIVHTVSRGTVKLPQIGAGGEIRTHED